MRRDNANENFFQVLLVVLRPQLGERAFCKQFAGLNDANRVAKLFNLAHDVRGEDDGFAAVPAFADESGDGASGHNIETDGRLVEDHHRRIMNESARDGGFLLHTSGKLVAAAVAEAVHVQTIENFVNALLKSRLGKAVEPGKIFDHFLRREAGIERGGGGEEAHVGADFLRIVDNIVAADDGGAVGGFEKGSEHAECGGFSGAVGPEQAIDFAGVCSESDMVDGVDGAAFFILEGFRQSASFDHAKIPLGETGFRVKIGKAAGADVRFRDLQCTTLARTERYPGTVTDAPAGRIQAHVAAQNGQVAAPR
jgi:hypothetical protein